MPKPPKSRDRGGDAEQLHRLARPRGPDTATFSRSTGAATRTPGQVRRGVRERLFESACERAASCSRAEPTSSWMSSPAEPVRLELATSTPSTSATPDRDAAARQQLLDRV